MQDVLMNCFGFDRRISNAIGILSGYEFQLKFINKFDWKKILCKSYPITEMNGQPRIDPKAKKKIKS